MPRIRNFVYDFKRGVRQIFTKEADQGAFHGGGFDDYPLAGWIFINFALDGTQQSGAPPRGALTDSVKPPTKVRIVK